MNIVYVSERYIICGFENFDRCFFSVVFHLSFIHIYVTGARMGSQRLPKRLQRTHETWAMCHLSGPEIWECGGCGI